MLNWQNATRPVTASTADCGIREPASENFPSKSANNGRSEPAKEGDAMHCAPATPTLGTKLHMSRGETTTTTFCIRSIFRIAAAGRRRSAGAQQPHQHRQHVSVIRTQTASRRQSSSSASTILPFAIRLLLPTRRSNCALRPPSVGRTHVR